MENLLLSILDQERATSLAIKINNELTVQSNKEKKQRNETKNEQRRKRTITLQGAKEKS